MTPINAKWIRASATLLILLGIGAANIWRVLHPLPSDFQAVLDADEHPLAASLGALVPVLVGTPIIYWLSGRWFAKRCTYCAERIATKAIVCKHCGRDIAAEDLPLIRSPSMSQSVANDADRSPLLTHGTLTLGDTYPATGENAVQQSPSRRSNDPVGLEIIIGVAVFLLACGIILAVGVSSKVSEPPPADDRKIDWTKFEGYSPNATGISRPDDPIGPKPQSE